MPWAAEAGESWASAAGRGRSQARRGRCLGCGEPRSVGGVAGGVTEAWPGRGRGVQRSRSADPADPLLGCGPLLLRSSAAQVRWAPARLRLRVPGSE